MHRRPASLFLCITVGLMVHLATTYHSAASPDSAKIQRERIALVPIVKGNLEHPLFLTHAGDGTARLFIVEQPGRIRILDQGVLIPNPFLDITDRVLSGGERGLLGLAFHRDFLRNGRLFVNYTRKPDGATVVAEYRRDSSPHEASREERILLVVSQPYANHNGGMMAFGPDGYLYIGLGDGGSGGDPENFAQNPNELLGKILRIDVDHGDPYGIPSDNPFAMRGGRPEIYATGLRNPWRFSFDSKTGDLWAADVGQKKWEEVDLIDRGGNYGWRVMEGSHCYAPAFFCETKQFIAPVLEYGHDNGRCSITGGYVYRGRTASLVGRYLYGDYCSGEIFLLSKTQEGTLGQTPDVALKAPFRISSFGEDETGELYVLDHAGGVYRIMPSSSP